MFKTNYRVAGCVNNLPLLVQANANIDPGSRTLEITLEPRDAPIQWDSALLLLGGLDVLLVICASSKHLDFLPREGLPVFSRSMSMLSDHGRSIGSLTISSYLSRADSALDCRAQLLHARTNLEPLEQIVGVHTPIRASVIANGSCSLLFSLAMSFETNRGNTYTGISTSYLGFPQDHGLDRLALLTIDTCDVRRNQEQGCERTSFHLETSLEMGVGD